MLSLAKYWTNGLCGVVACTVLSSVGNAQARNTVLADSMFVSPSLLGDPAVGKLLMHWIARELRGASEPPLYGRDSGVDVRGYRFTRLGTWGGMTSLRLERRESTWTLVRKRTAPGAAERWRDRTIQVADSVAVSDEDAARIVRTVVQSERWRTPPPRCDFGNDGIAVVMEARDETGYAVITCWEPRPTTAPAVVNTIRAYSELEARAFPRLAPPTR